MPLKQGGKVGEYYVAVGSNVVWLESISFKDLQEEVAGRKREASLHPSLGHHLFSGKRSRRWFVPDESPGTFLKESFALQVLEVGIL